MIKSNKDNIFDQNSIPVDVIQHWKEKGQKIVFTNGCFDLLHRGHIQYLAEAAALGDKLIVGLNSDSSVRLIKGAERPIKDQLNRSAILAALKMVDMVILFDEASPLGIIKKILPDVLAKGGDWPVEQIVGYDVVIKNKGLVKTLSFIEGESTSRIIEKIRNIKS